MLPAPNRPSAKMAGSFRWHPTPLQTAPSLDKASPEAEALLARWGLLHAVRSALSFVAFASFLILLAKG